MKTMDLSYFIKHFLWVNNLCLGSKVYNRTNSNYLAGNYMFKVIIETVEHGTKYVQS